MSLPKATVERIIKARLKEKGIKISISKEVKNRIVKYTEEFISRIAENAQDICEKEKKKTMSNDHIISAIKEMGFGEYENELKGIITQLNEDDKKKKQRRRSKKQLSSGMTKEQLIAEQNRLFKAAKLRNAKTIQSIQVQKPKQKIPEKKEESQNGLFDTKNVKKAKSSFFFGKK